MGNKRILIDAIFDGVGSNGNGHVASGIASDALEISLLSGWIVSPEDVRRTIIMADLAIVMAQIASKHSSIPTQEVAMSTTATISYQEGMEFYGIHAGDSVYAVLDRRGGALLRSQDHSFCAQVRERDGIRIDPRLDYVTSLLGGALLQVDINNAHDLPPPFILEPGNLVLTCSDGFLANVCTHEAAGALFDSMPDSNASENLALAARMRARSRQVQGTHFPTCVACAHGRKNDDITLAIRSAGSILENLG